MDETTRPKASGSDGDRVDVVEGPVGSASLKEPAEVERSTPELDALPSIEDAAAGSDDSRR